MQHLEDAYGIRDPPVPYVVQANVEPPTNFQDFMEFPRRLGWKIDPVNYELDVDAARTHTLEPMQSLLQAWLFFGLIYTVVQDDGQPLLAKSQLLERNNPDYITTHLLPSQLSTWKESCVKDEQENTHRSRLRTIRVDNVLDLARRVVRANLVDRTRAEAHVGQHHHVPDEVVLSIMILGETLCSARNHIMDETGMRMTGWYDEDERGWGPPIYVRRIMRENLWCPRATHLLLTQLRSNATLLVAASKNKSPSTTGQRHYDPKKPCTDKVCYETPEDSHDGYIQCHCEAFCDKKKQGGVCREFQGPDNNVVRSLLQQNKRPLLQFHTDVDDTFELKVLDWDKDEVEYATISHVWSDGFGNPDRNELRSCQLRFIRNQLHKLENDEQSVINLPSRSLPFWMDTLIIPAGGDAESEKLKKEGIKQITRIFRDSAHTIVVDLGLLSMSSEGSPTQTAMKVLASNWMRRLWTLQEAYLSRSIHVAFQHPAKGLRQLEILFKNLTDTGDLTSDLVNMVHNQLQQNLMQSEREQRHAHTASSVGAHALIARKSVLVANAWKAARWRTTSNELHETLALATLLELNFDTRSEIVEAGLAKDAQWRNKPTEERDGHRDRLMKQFWTIFNDTYQDAIPPGIVFLPPPRLQVEGFGWAPRTWMSAHEVDFPDPLSFTGLEYTSHLDLPKGLRIRFPGFLIHTGSRHKVLLTDQNEKKFQFPVDPKLQEWYVVERIDDPGEPTWFRDSILNMTDQLAIILSRPRPRGSQAEIGLLVQISDAREDQDGSGRRRVTQREDGQAFVCSIIRRVKVSRSTEASIGLLGQASVFHGPASGSESSLSHRIMVSTDQDADICIGEILKSNQTWIVDGFPPTRDLNQQGQRLQETPEVDKDHKRLLFHKHKKPDANPLDSSTTTGEPVASPSRGPIRGETIDVASTLPTASFKGPTRTNLPRRKTFGVKMSDTWESIKRRMSRLR